MKKLGYHIILDLYDCKKNLTIEIGKVEGILYDLREKIREYGMTPLCDKAHVFENGSWSGMILLAESHVSVHTWPELNYVSADVFVCNYSKDNSEGAEKMAEWLGEFFDAKGSNTEPVSRGGRLEDR